MERKKEKKKHSLDAGPSFLSLMVMLTLQHLSLVFLMRCLHWNGMVPGAEITGVYKVKWRRRRWWTQPICSKKKQWSLLDSGWTSILFIPSSSSCSNVFLSVAVKSFRQKENPRFWFTAKGLIRRHINSYLNCHENYILIYAD